MREIRVLSVIDSLIAAGAERMAVNVANALLDKGVKSYLCATHHGGDLKEFVDKNVPLLILNKKDVFDFPALIRLRNYVKSNSIDIIHAHSSSVYWAVIIKIILRGKVKVVWHDHYGYSEHLDKRALFLLKVVSRFLDYAFVVNDKLLAYAIDKIGIDRSKVSFLPNFADLKDVEKDSYLQLPGKKLYPKIVSLANMRPQKDHHTLLDAFSIVRAKIPNAALYLIGGHFNDDYYRGIIERINSEKALAGHVFVTGSRNDVAQILKQCDIGVLSSISEGLPVSLLEYGMAQLPVVCTDTGDCASVLEYGRYGRIVKPSDSIMLANEILSLIEDSLGADVTAKAFKQHVLNYYSADSAVTNIISIYKKILVRTNH
ncbi:glycosyltransferase [Marinilabiliaceae bacterium ANBcel2]|nr:glycosyltransferase [Marinilabiliaceae bacterium ANBcel2]